MVDLVWVYEILVDASERVDCICFVEAVDNEEYEIDEDWTLVDDNTWGVVENRFWSEVIGIWLLVDTIGLVVLKLDKIDVNITCVFVKYEVDKLAIDMLAV